MIVLSGANPSSWVMTFRFNSKFSGTHYLSAVNRDKLQKNYPALLQQQATRCSKWSLAMKDVKSQFSPIPSDRLCRRATSQHIADRLAVVALAGLPDIQCLPC